MNHSPETREDRSIVAQAFSVAIDAHHGQTDKSGKPYIEHCMRVSKQGKNEAERVVGLLHDVVEDTRVTLAQLRQQGFSNEIIEAVDALTKRRGETQEKYLLRLKKNPLALAVKLRDIEDNCDPQRLASLSEKTRARLELEYAQAKKILLNGHSLQD